MKPIFEATDIPLILTSILNSTGRSAIYSDSSSSFFFPANSFSIKLRISFRPPQILKSLNIISLFSVVEECKTKGLLNIARSVPLKIYADKCTIPELWVNKFINFP